MAQTQAVFPTDEKRSSSQHYSKGAMIYGAPPAESTAALVAAAGLVMITISILVGLSVFGLTYRGVPRQRAVTPDGPARNPPGVIPNTQTPVSGGGGSQSTQGRTTNNNARTSPGGASWPGHTPGHGQPTQVKPGGTSWSAHTAGPGQHTPVKTGRASWPGHSPGHGPHRQVKTGPHTQVKTSGASWPGHTTGLEPHTQVKTAEASSPAYTGGSGEHTQVKTGGESWPAHAMAENATIRTSDGASWTANASGHENTTDSLADTTEPPTETETKTALATTTEVDETTAKIVNTIMIIDESKKPTERILPPPTTRIARNLGPGECLTVANCPDPYSLCLNGRCACLETFELRNGNCVCPRGSYIHRQYRLQCVACPLCSYINVDQNGCFGCPPGLTTGETAGDTINDCKPPS